MANLLPAKTTVNFSADLFTGVGLGLVVVHVTISGVAIWRAIVGVA